MLFPTVEYMLFFLAVLAIAWSLYRFHEAHKAFLLLASYVFYGFWNWQYIPLLFFISLFSGLVAQRIQRTTDARARKRWLIAGVVVCLATLGYFKYTTFLLTNLLDLWARFAPPPSLPIESPLLPLGVSFFVFHAISLLGDCYRGKVKQPVQLRDALLYVAFFPQLIAGPILRASRFLPQLAVRRNPNALRINRALRRFGEHPALYLLRARASALLGFNAQVVDDLARAVYFSRQAPFYLRVVTQLPFIEELRPALMRACREAQDDGEAPVNQSS